MPSNIHQLHQTFINYNVKLFIEVMAKVAQVVSNREKRTKTKGRLKLIACLKCKTERDGEMPESVSNEDGFCWLCPGCFESVKKGDEGNTVVKREEIADCVASEMAKHTEAIMEKITERLNLSGIGDANRTVTSVGERSFADVVSRKPAAKIHITNAGDSGVSQVTEALKQTPVSFLRADKDGNVTIALPEQSMLEKAENQLKAVLPEAATLRTTVRLPKVTIKEFPLPLEDFPLDMERKDLNESIVRLIGMKNHEVRSLIEEGHVFEVVYVGKSRSRGRANVAARVSCSIHGLLVSNGKLFVGNESCRVEDRFHIPQCFCCQKFGHKAYECEQSHPTCMFCAESHETRNCPNRRNVRCVNCTNANDPRIKSGACSHTAGSAECPVFQLKVKQAKNW